MSEKQLDDLLDRVLSSDGAVTPQEPRANDERSYYIEYHKNRFRAILNAVPANERLAVLDIGPTALTLVVKELFPSYDVAAIDVVARPEVVQRMKSAGIDFRLCDLTKQSVPFQDGAFDVVIMTEVMEHLFAKHEVVLAEIHRVMRNGGRLIFSVPNMATLTNRVRFLLGVNPTKWELNDDGAHGHLHEFTMAEAVDLLQRSHFTIESRFVIDNCRRRNTWIPKKDRPRFMPLPSLRQTLFFVCSRV